MRGFVFNAVERPTGAAEVAVDRIVLTMGVSSARLAKALIVSRWLRWPRLGHFRPLHLH